MSWYNPTSWFIDEENLQAGNEAYRQSQVLNERTAARIEEQEGPIAADRYWAVVAGQSAGQVVSPAEAESQVNDAFMEGLQEGADNLSSGINATLKAPFQFAWSAIPWQVWAVGLVALFIYAGGGLWLRGRLAKLN